MKQLLSMALLVFSISTLLQGQAPSSKLNLDDYEPGEQRYRFLNYEFGLESTELESGSIGLIARMNSFRNTEKRQIETSISGGLISSDSNGLSFFGSFDYKSRNYLLKKVPKLFFVGNVKVNTITNDNITNFGFEGSIGLGFGRINVVNEIEIAERILNALTDNSEILNQVHIKSLATFIMEAKNSRFMVNRSEWEDEIAPLYEYLTELGYNTTGETLQKVLRNIYKKESLIMRESGQTISLIGSYSERSTRFNFIDFSSLTTPVSLAIEKKRYVNSKIQQNTSLSLGLLYGQVENRQDFVITSLNNSTSLNLNLSHTFHYLPNIDNRFSATINGGYTRIINSDFEFMGTSINFPQQLEPSFNLGTNLEYERRFGRNQSATLGLNVNYNTFTRLSVTSFIKIRF